jgi:hypothetical protein
MNDRWIDHRLTTYRPLLTNIREVEIYMPDHKCHTQKDFARFISDFPHWLKWFGGLSKLTLEFFATTWLSDHPKREQIFESLMNRISNQIGVQGQFVPELQTWAWRVPTSQVWVWQAASGQLMDWNQDFKNLWINPNVWGASQST